ncbi:ABC transporter permease [Paenibacillus aquistagni]|nr:ABC transporter permease [Paenibacillus aquistagni]
MLLHPIYRWIVLLVGLPVNFVVLLFYLYQRRSDTYSEIRRRTKQELLDSDYKKELQSSFAEQLDRKEQFFGGKISEQERKRQIERWTEEEFNRTLEERTEARLAEQGQTRLSFADTFAELMNKPWFWIFSGVLGLPMHLMILLYNSPYLKYLMERLVMTLLVILGVAIVVFTILHLSPLNPAANILGETATKEQIDNFNQIYGLDQPYLVQLWNNLKGILTFDLGKSFAGNEQVTTAIANKFPITLTLSVISLFVALIIAIPVGMISATRPNSFFDYTFMFIALLGLSIPNFWQGLIFILNFSIKLHWLPATFNPQNWLSMIMPVIVLGTGLTAAVARMTRSSMLEVINEDYILTARAKGLKRRGVLLRHAASNAMIPIITVVGLQFGGILGGAAVTEKVFNISGIGSYIVDKQFIPDIPAIMGGVVYTAITISIINVMIDILYAFFDPRIRSKMKQY